jgi:D-glycero-alpha-D-manno-heptose 1-phosphate guanylyltransferase
MQAIILAGGFGTRLRSVLSAVPKPMAPIHGKPFLAYLTDYLIAQGITEIVFSVHYLGEQISDYFQSTYRGIKIQYAVEEEPLGTGGAIVNSLQFIDQNKPVFVLNGDTFLKLDYQEMFALHNANTRITMALRRIADCSRYGVVLTQDNSVIAFQEQGTSQPGLINAGVYLLNPDLFQGASLPAQFSFEKDFLFPEITRLQPRAFIVDEYFIDIGIPSDYARAIEDFVTSSFV